MPTGPNIATQHPQYVEAFPKWQRCRDLIEGSDRVKGGSTYGGVFTQNIDPAAARGTVAAESYLPTPPGMDGWDYSFYLARAQFFNAMARTVTAMAGAVFTKPPTVEAPAAIATHLEDLTLLDEPLDVVAMRIVSEVLSVGRTAIFLDMPPAENGAEAARPYWVTIPAERVINWRTAQVGTAPNQIVMVVIREDVEADPDPYSHKTRCQYKELALVGGFYQARIWTEIKGKAEYLPGPWMMPTRRGERIPWIPFWFVGVDGVSPDVSKPPLLDLADVNIGHFRNSADLEQGLFKTAIPIPVTSGTQANSAPLKVGGSTAWQLPMGGTAEYLEFSGAGLGMIVTAMAAKERLMASLGARLLEDTSQRADETATAIRIRHGGDSASLRTIAGAASTAMTSLLRWHAWWFQGTGALDLKIKVALCREFLEVKASPEEVRVALDAVEAGKMSLETYYDLLQRGGWAREGVDYAQELEQIKREAAERDAKSQEQANAAARKALEAGLAEPPAEEVPA